MATEGKTKAPVVDGKRLAQLESGVSALAMVLAANGITLDAGADPIEQTIAIVKRWRELTGKRGELVAAVSTVVGVAPEEVVDPFTAAIVALESMKERIVGLEGDIASRSKRIAALEEENKELQTDVEDLSSAKNALANQLAGKVEDQGATAADEPAAVVEALPPAPRERPETARDVGPTFGKLSHAELKILVESGAQFELAFSNGEFEIIDFSSPPIVVKAADLVRIDSSRFVVGATVLIKGGVASELIHGAGLLLDGVQVGYGPLEPAALVLPGHEWRFDRSLVFG